MAKKEKNARKNFGAVIRDARKAKGLEGKEFASKVGIDPPYLSKIETGSATIPSKEVIDALAGELGLDVDELLFILAPEAVDRVREEFKPYIRIDREPEKPNTEPAFHSGKRVEGRFPIVGLAACGPLMEAIQNDRLPHGELRTTEPWEQAVEIAKSKRAFVVEAEGESMLPTLEPGDELLVDPRASLTAPPKPPIVLALIQGEATVKRWNVSDDIIVLTPDNPNRIRFGEIRMTKEEFAVKGGIAWRVVLSRRSSRH